MALLSNVCFLLGSVFLGAGTLINIIHMLKG